jgi:hypothetical protein
MASLRGGAQDKAADNLSSREFASKAEVKRWMAQLGDAVFARREEATQKLLAADYPVAVLLPALNSPNAETRLRARRIASQQFLVARERLFVELPVMAQQGSFDRYVAALMAHSTLLERELAEPILNFRKEMLEWAGRSAAKATPEQRPPDLRYFHRCDVASDFHSFQCLTFANSGQFSGRGRVNSSILVLDGPIRDEGATFGSLMLVNGPASLKMLTCSFLFVLGDLQVQTGIGGSVVFCTGDVKCLAISNSQVFAGGTIDVQLGPGQVTDSVVRPKGAFFKEIKCFAVEQMGIQVVAENERVQIRAVKSDSQLARAGVRGGDRLLAINDEPITSVKQLTKNLRTRSVEFLPFQVRIERDGKALDLIVRYRPPK